MLAAVEQHGHRAVGTGRPWANRAVRGEWIGVLDYFGRVDIVVNIAGVYFTGRIDEPDRDQAAFDRRYIFLQCLSGYYVA
jgi:hypothetical protein